MNLAENVGVYKPVTATCGVTCVSCCGYGSAGVQVAISIGGLAGTYVANLSVDKP